MTAVCPLRPHAEQRERLRDVVAARAHRRRAPHRQADRARVIAVLLQVALDQLLRRFQADRPRRLRRHRARIDRVEVAARRQHVGPAARRRAARPRRHETPFEAAPQLAQFFVAARVEARQHVAHDALEHRVRVRPVRGGVFGRGEARRAGRRIASLARRASIAAPPLDQAARERLEPLARVARMPPRLVAHRAERGGPRPCPRRGPVGCERIERLAEREIARERADQPGALAAPVARRKACERRERVAPLPAARRTAERMQPVADLRLLQFAKPRVDAREQRVLRVAPGGRRDAQFLVQLVLDDGRENRLAQHLRAARVDHQRIVVFVDLPLEVLQRPVILRAREGRHQVVDDHRLRAPLRLAALARIVDDERIQVRHRPEDQVRPACVR
ncbi:hypothetical protein BG97_3559 [Burkholderia pseudomallei 7894]|nr:hypothetical protein BG97_3559 [Burkholderia pseudomallei 7894]